MIYRPKNKILSLLVQTAEFCLIACDGLFFFLIRFFPCPQNKHVLIVRLDAIGDFVIWLAAAKKIRAIYPDQRITLLGNALWTDLAGKLPWFDSVLPLNRKRFFMNPLYRYRILARVRRGGFTIALHAVYHRDFLVGDVCTRASGAPVRIGFAGSAENSTPWQKRIGDTWYTALVPSGEKHQLEQDGDFLRALGADYRETLPTLPRLPLPRDFPVTDYYVIIPGAGHEMRRWPLARFQEIARRTHAKTGLTAVLCGGMRESDVHRAFSNGPDAVPVVDMVGRTSLPDLVAIIAHAQFVVGNDTGAIHIAIATSTPAVCILGGAHPGRYVPYPPTLNARLKTVMHPMDCFHCDWYCTYDTTSVVPCINAISVDDVWKAVEEIVSGT